MTDEERERHRAIREAAFHLYIVASYRLVDKSTPADLEAVWQRLFALRWQSIDSAPRDGTRFLAHWNGGLIGPVRWCGWWDSDGFTQPEPTAWMPLPPVKEVV